MLKKMTQENLLTKCQMIRRTITKQFIANGKEWKELSQDNLTTNAERPEHKKFTSKCQKTRRNTTRQFINKMLKKLKKNVRKKHWKKFYKKKKK